MLKLFHSFSFKELYTTEGLEKLDYIFLKWLEQKSQDLFQLLVNSRNIPPSSLPESDAIIKLAPLLEEFLGSFFSIEAELKATKESHNAFDNFFLCKKNFVQRHIARQFKIADDEIELKISAAVDLIEGANVKVDDDLEFSNAVMLWQQNIDKYQDLYNAAEIYAAWALKTKDGRKKSKDSVLFKIPQKLDYDNLIDVDLPSHNINLIKALDNATYCIHCHNQGKDSCSKGMLKDATLVKNPLGITLAGCPLEEKISEMNFLKKNGYIIGALATAIIDNPMIAATGHRICNDCMKSCIYQKQEPVDIPLVETENLEQVLNLPYGFEIYSLLTRWNPLNFRNYLPKYIDKHKVLIAGLGPAGFTLAHYLLNAGFTVVGIDGLKIEHLPSEISGVDKLGNRHDFKPIRDIKSELYDDLDSRIPQGFGGVMEYGITSRWNKNYLKVIRLLLERRENFRMYGSVRFGGTIDYNKASSLGFDHIALALGAGKPNIPKIPNILAKGARTASDFLMTLQLLGANLKDSIASLQIRLPVVVIGGGLTAIDTATESLSYYALQVEKFLYVYEKLGEALLSELNSEELEIAQEFIMHGAILRKSPTKRIEILKKWGGVKIVYRKSLQESPSYRLNHEEVKDALRQGVQFIENITPLEVIVGELGNVLGLKHENGIINAKTILIATGTSPNTTLTSEDPEHFILDGLHFKLVDEYGSRVQPGKNYVLSYVAAQANSELGRDDNTRYAKRPIPAAFQEVGKAHEVKANGVYTSYMTELESEVQRSQSLKGDGYMSISTFGDLHPSYSGNVVKAMASAKLGWGVIAKQLSNTSANSDLPHSEFFKILDNELIAVVKSVEMLTPNIAEIIVRAPLAAKQFQPGQFYRLQNYANSKMPTTEGVALTGAHADKDAGLLSMIALKLGASSDIIANLEDGEVVSVMGPTGTPTFIPKNKTVMLVGGGLGNAVLFSIGKAMRESGCKVLYFAGYKNSRDIYKIKEIEDAADCVVWCSEHADLKVNIPQIPEFELIEQHDQNSRRAVRESDYFFSGNVIDGILAYDEINRPLAKPVYEEQMIDGDLEKNGGIFHMCNDLNIETTHVPLEIELCKKSNIKLQDVEHIIAVGSDKMMAAVVRERHGKLKNLLKWQHVAFASINSPMQCMMKGICAQCLQRQIDPNTGEESYVYSCKEQDQNMDYVDFNHLDLRLRQNSLQEKISRLLLGVVKGI